MDTLINFNTAIGQGLYDISSHSLYINDVLTCSSIEIGKMPNRLYLLFNTHCNLNCTYCFQHQYKKKEYDSLYITDYKALLDQICKEHYDNIIMFGGEPLLDENLTSLEYLLNTLNHENYVIYTNGNFSDNIFNLLSQHIGKFAYFLITIDGTEEVHNKRRINPHSNSFKNIMLNIERLCQITSMVSIQINVDKANMDNIPTLLNYLYTLPYTKNCNILINPVKYTNLSIEDFSIFDLFFEAKKNFPDLNINLNSKIYSNFVNYILNQPITLERCCVGSTKIFDFEQKTIYACPQNNTTVIGTFNNNNYEINQTKIDIYHKYSQRQQKSCLNCPYLFLCDAGCLFSKPSTDCQTRMYNILTKLLTNFDLLFNIKAE